MIAPAQPLTPALLYTPREAARLLSVSERTLARLARRGDIVPVRLGAGRIVRYPRTVLEKFIDEQAAASVAVEK